MFISSLISKSFCRNMCVDKKQLNVVCFTNIPLRNTVQMVSATISKNCYFTKQSKQGKHITHIYEILIKTFGRAQKNTSEKGRHSTASLVLLSWRPLGSRAPFVLPGSHVHVMEVEAAWRKGPRAKWPQTCNEREEGRQAFKFQYKGKGQPSITSLLYSYTKVFKNEHWSLRLCALGRGLESVWLLLWCFGFLFVLYLCVVLYWHTVIVTKTSQF